MNRTHATIARTLRQDIGAEFTLICSKPQGQVAQPEYLDALSRSQQAQSLARYLSDHLCNVNPRAFCEAAGIRSHANR